MRNKILAVPLVLCICVVVLVSISYGRTTKSMIVICPECPEISVSCPQPNVSCPKSVFRFSCPSCPELPLFMMEARVVAMEKNYNLDIYDCTDYSRTLFHRLKEVGYVDTKFCVGLDKQCFDETRSYTKCAHSWVKIGESIVIEATSGHIVAIKDYKSLYIEHRCYHYFPEEAT